VGRGNQWRCAHYVTKLLEVEGKPEENSKQRDDSWHLQIKDLTSKEAPSFPLHRSLGLQQWDKNGGREVIIAP